VLQLVLLIAGLVTVCAGLAWIYPPAGIVTAGGALAAFALLWDFGDRR